MKLKTKNVLRTMRNKSDYRTHILLLISLIATTLNAQNESKREIINSWDNIESVAVTHRYGNLDVMKSANGSVSLEVEITVRADKLADAKTVVEHFDIEQRQSGSALELQTKFNTKTWTQNGNLITIKFEDGDKARSVRDISISYNLYVPDLDVLKLSNKYNDINLHEDVKAREAHFKAYDANIQAGNIEGNVKVEIKYGEGEFTSVNDADIYLYDSKLELEVADNVELQTKYSDFEIGNCTSLNLTSYDDNGTITKVEGNLVISDKYGEYQVGSVGSADISIYDGEVRLDEAKSWVGKSKYSELKIGNVETIELDYSFDDDIEINSVGDFLCDGSKYSAIDIRTLKHTIRYGILR